MATPFFKMSGSGNDFIVLDGRVSPPGDWPPEQIVRVCERRHGVGADGLVVLTPMDAGSVRMTFFNSDGSRAAMCGNAALCSTRLSARLGMAPPEAMRLVTDAGTYRTRSLDPGERAEVNLADFPVPGPVPTIVPEAGERTFALATVGVPHLVIQVEDVDRVDLARRGRELRHHPAVGAAGANANFVSAPPSPGLPWRIRTFERGVEGETLACGTGTVAAAAAMAAAGQATLPASFVSRGGALLTVAGRLDAGVMRDVWLGGEGRLVFEGVLA